MRMIFTEHQFNGTDIMTATIKNLHHQIHRTRTDLLRIHRHFINRLRKPLQSLRAAAQQRNILRHT